MEESALAFLETQSERKKVNMKGFVITAAALLATVALAQASIKLVVNGQPSALPAITVNGATYIPLSALERAGAKVTRTAAGLTLTLPGGSSAPSSQMAAGGANQRVSLEGCIGETLFNGIWRLTVKSVKAINRYNGQQLGYSLSLEWKNGAKVTADALNTGIKNLNLVLSDGTVLQTDDAQSLTSKKLPQGAGVALELAFYTASGVTADKLGKPDKFLVEIDPLVLKNTGVATAYTTPNPSFRVRLDCQK